MTYPADFPRPMVLRAGRETIALVVGAMAVTFALSNVIHGHRDPSRLASNERRSVAVEQEWTGQLAGLTPPTVEAQSAPFTSASLVIPRSELALPRVRIRPLVKLHGCEGSACGAKPAGVPAQRRLTAASQLDEELDGVSVSELAPVKAVLKRESPRVQSTLMSRVNPINHLPDMSTIRRPFSFASETVSGWFKRF